MTSPKLHIGIVCGGRSEVFALSVKGGVDIAAAVDPSRYKVSFFVLDQDHRWFLSQAGAFAGPRGLEAFAFDAAHMTEVMIGPRGSVIDKCTGEQLATLDVVFPTLYGLYGEDGKLQGMLEMLDLPYVGAGVTASAICMDKDIAKRLVANAGVATAESILLRSASQVTFDEASEQLGVPFFVKPCRMGSSVGISKVRTAEEYRAAIAEAFRYGRKVMLERASFGREIRTAIIGNEHPQVAMTIGEVPLGGGLDFYDYHAKLNNPINRIPASLDEQVAEHVRELSRRVYQALEIEGMARIDWFLEADGTVLFGEANTLPCFSAGSTFRELWAHSGVENSGLIGQLVALAQARFKRNREFAYSGLLAPVS
ncbi:MAG: D-alanine--D-alanine ligase [Cyanobacteria bacterium RYN_339]|nr:D-alanine--D-alanine ligase [Cyanobacteria bacterium RYN_339]